MVPLLALRHSAASDVGVREDREQDVWRIKKDLLEDNWFGLARIRPLRCTRTIAERHGMKEMGLSRSKWSVDVPRVAEPGCIRRFHHRRHPACVVFQPGRDHHCRGRLGDHHMPGGRRPLSPANVGETEDRDMFWRTNEDLLEDKGGSDCLRVPSALFIHLFKHVITNRVSSTNR